MIALRPKAIFGRAPWRGCVAAGILFVVLQGHTRAVAQTRPTAIFGESHCDHGDAYCGLYSLYAAGRILGKEIHFADLLDAKYIGQKNGSTIGELQRAAEDNHLYAFPVDNLTATALAECPYMVILHVRPRLTDEAFNHFVLCLKGDGRSVNVYDAPRRPMKMVAAELMALSDGSGLVISDRPVDRWQLVRWTQYRMLFYGIAVVASAAFYRLSISQRIPKIRSGPSRATSRAVIQAIFIASGAACLGTARAALSGVGLLSRPEIVQGILADHQLDFVPRLDVEDVQGAIANGGSVLVDARYAADFENGHIPDAINIPPDFSDADRNRALGAVPAQMRIIVYCQSASCPFAGRAANAIRSQGFAHIALYPGGWTEWTAAKR